MRASKHHEIIYIAAGLFKTACGRYVDGPDKERCHALLHKITCKSCQRTHHKASMRRCCFSSPWGGPHQDTCKAA